MQNYLLFTSFSKRHFLHHYQKMKYLSSHVLRALQLAIEAHAGQTDKAGRPYIHHPVTVAMILAKNGFSDLHITAALLHDIVEDTRYTFDDLKRMGFPAEVIEALTQLTHNEEVPYMDYVRAAARNPIARAVKTADLLHNLDTSRLPHPTDSDLARWDKYREALALLRDCE